MATNTIDTSYVIVTNVSDDAQTAFETSNSWGYYAVSFELQTVDGRTLTITKKPQAFYGKRPDNICYSTRRTDGFSSKTRRRVGRRSTPAHS